MRCLARVAALVLLLTGCASTSRCPSPDLGAWMVDVETDHAIQHTCTACCQRFVLQVAARRTPDGREVAEWTSLATLDVPLDRGESTMAGFDCGSSNDMRGDAIAVVRYDRNGGFEIQRAWTIDVANRRFVPVQPGTVICESIDE